MIATSEDIDSQCWSKTEESIIGMLEGSSRDMNAAGAERPSDVTQDSPELLQLVWDDYELTTPATTPSPASSRSGSPQPSDSDCELIFASEIDRDINATAPLDTLNGTMTAEFSEGRLDTSVGKPQKELPGTKDAYVSYLVTTKVGLAPLHL
jgi:hypothetical protein